MPTVNETRHHPTDEAVSALLEQRRQQGFGTPSVEVADQLAPLIAGAVFVSDFEQTAA